MLPDKEPVVIELDIKKLMTQNIVLTVGLAIFFIAIQYIYFKDFDFSFSKIVIGILLFFVLYMLLIVLHEAFHLIGFLIFGGVPFKSLKYGINLELGVAYATTDQALPNHAMKKALLLPFWTTGVLPTLVGFYLNSTVLVIVGACLIGGAIGDFAMYKELRNYPKDALIKDDPNLPKLYVYSKESRET